MKHISKKTLIRLFIALVVITALALLVHPQATFCLDDEDLGKGERTTIEQAAVQFVKDLITNHSDSAYAAISSEVKAKETREAFNAFIQKAILPTQFDENVRLEHTYLAEVHGGGNSARVVCGHLDAPQNWVALNAKSNARTAYVLVDAETRNNSWVFVVWLLQEQGKWRIQGAYPVTTAMAGKSANDLWQMARQEKAAGHPLNAYLLYAAAYQFAQRGNEFQLGIQPEIGKELQSLQSPFPGQPPFDLQLDGETYKILGIGPIGIAGKIYLIIQYEADPWTNTEEIVGKNKKLLASFAKKYPEYSAVFADVIARAHERGTNRGQGTLLHEDAKAP